MKILQEVTNWKCDIQPNHTYYVRDNGKLWGYIPMGKTEVVRLKSEPPFSRQYRKFVTLGTIQEE